MLLLTLGHIGSDTTTAEHTLLTWFQLAERWGAVVAFTEADVLFEQRQAVDLERSTSVSGWSPHGAYGARSPGAHADMY